MIGVRVFAVGVAGAVAASLLALAPAIGAPTRGAVASKPRVALPRTAIGSFTPASADPQLAAALSRSGISAGSFRFTPAASLRLNRSVTVAVRARTNSRPTPSSSQQVALVAPAASPIAPVAYNLGVSLGWRKFAVTGDMAKLDLAGIGRRDVMDVGVSYTTQRLTTRVQVGADRATGVAPRALANGDGVQVDFGGSYALSRNLDVTAGVRYRAEREQRLLTRGDDRRDSQAVYVGTAVKF